MKNIKKSVQHKEKYWLSLEQWGQDKNFQKLARDREFTHPLPSEKEAENLWERREFLQLMAASMALAGLGCVRRPTEKIVPYIKRPEDVSLGKASLYSSSYFDGEEGFGILVKTREGRPIKIEGNKDHPVNQGGLSARAHSHILSLYDPERLKNPQQNLFNDKKTNREKIRAQYTTADAEIVSYLKSNLKSRGRKGKTAFLTGEWPSPSSENLLKDFCKKTACSHFVWNPLNHSAIEWAQKLCYGKALVPRFALDRARLILSINCDFLGTWLYPTEFNRLYAKGRSANRDMNRLIVFESLLSLTGTNADWRVRIKPSQQLDLVLAVIYSLIQKGFSKAKWPSHLKSPSDPYKAFHIDKKSWDHLIQELWENRGQSLVLAGNQQTGKDSKSLQIATAWLNHLLGNDGYTVDYRHPYRTWTWANRKIEELIKNLEQEKINMVIIHKTNPLYTYPDKERLKSALRKAKLVVYTGDREDETGREARYILPDHHDLEKWSDWEFQKGTLSIQQPTIRPLYHTRAFESALIKWTGLLSEQSEGVKGFKEKSWFEYLRNNVIAHAKAGFSWDHFLKIGVNIKKPEQRKSRFPARSFNVGALSVIGSSSVAGRVADSRFHGKDNADSVMGSSPGMGQEVDSRSPQTQGEQVLHGNNDEAYELLLYTTSGLKDGTLANVSWLMEFPDPVTKICWDNYLCVSPLDARKRNLKEGQIVKILVERKYMRQETAGGESVSKSAQEKSSFSDTGLSLKSGNEQAKSNKKENQINLQVPVHIQPGQADGVLALALGYGRERAGKVGNQVGVNAWPMAKVSSEGQVSFYSSFARMEATSKKIPLANTQGHHSMEGRQIVVETTLKKYLKNPGGAIHRHKMFSLWSSHQYPKHKWGMVIDLNSCTGCSACVVACQSENNIPTVGKDMVLQGREMHWIRVDRYYKGAPKAPEALHQPVVCMHCDNAPCETVCPVVATVHSDEGTNDMIYNRCVGTRYCANNCPYKVRRFNWFNYAKKMEKPLNMALNPDVTVRSRGVMEKCTFCLHRIRSAQAQAKLENRELKDGDVQTACQQSCPAGAIVFGDLKDKSSEVYRLFTREDSYSLLEELNTQPAVRYQVKVRNKEDSGSSEKDDPHHG